MYGNCMVSQAKGVIKAANSFLPYVRWLERLGARRDAQMYRCRRLTARRIAMMWREGKSCNGRAECLRECG